MRWLFAQKKWKDLERVLKSCFKRNNIHRKKNNECDLKVLEPVKWSHMVVKRDLRFRTFWMILNWSLIGFVHTGLGVTISNFPSDIFINFFATISAEILGFVFNLIFVDHIGRKPTLLLG
jgi:hypothetical protein